MAYSYNVYTGNGSTTQFTIGFPYIRREHVKVYVAYVDTAYTYVNNTTVQLATAPGAGVRVEVRRVTPFTPALVDYADGSTLVAADLDTSNLQHLYLEQELDDANKQAIYVDPATGLLTAASQRITNVVDPANAQDAATKNYVDNFVGSTANIANGAVTTAKLADNSVTSAKIVDGTIVAGDLASDSVTTAKVANTAITAAKLATDSVTTAKVADGAITNAKLADADLQTLAGMQAGAATALAALTAAEVATLDGITSSTAELNILDGVTADATEINKLDGLTASTSELSQLAGKTISGTLTPGNTNDIPTSSAVNSWVSNLINALGGFVAIANRNSFPTENPDPSDNAGTVVSIADAGGLIVSAGGTATNAQTTGAVAVTITGFPAAYQSKTLNAGLGIQVQTTSTLNTYTFHKSIPTDADIAQLSDDVNDFFARYRIGTTNPTTDLDAGDLFFNTSTGKMLVYDGTTSSWEEVQSIGNFFINTLSSSAGTGGGSASFNGTAYRFTLSNPPLFAQQLLVSVNGVLQKPNSGTSQPAEGFAIDGNDIVFSQAPATSSPFFIVTMGSTVNIGTPSDGTVSTAKLADSAVTTAKIDNGAVTTAKLGSDLTVDLASGSAASPSLYFDANTGVYSPGEDQVAVATNGTGRLFVDASGNVGVGGNSNSYAGLTTLTVNSSTGGVVDWNISNTRTGTFAVTSSQVSLGSNTNIPVIFTQANSEKMRLTSTGLGIGTNSASKTLHVYSSSFTFPARIETNGTGSGIELKDGTTGANAPTVGAIGDNFYVTTNNSERFRCDASGRLLVGTSSAFDATADAVIQAATTNGAFACLGNSDTSVIANENLGLLRFFSRGGSVWEEGARIEAEADLDHASGDKPTRLVFSTTADGASSPTERCRIDSAGHFLLNKTAPNVATNGVELGPGGGGYLSVSRGSDVPFFVNRNTSDGTLVNLNQDGTTEGTISVSGTTVSYNGAHLSRWSQLPSGAERIEILRGTVLSNIDEMCEWGEEDNEQLNRMKISDVEGDKNVSGVFQCWDDDDDTYTNDFYCAMTGDFIIRIAEGVTVERGDLLMSAGDGTAKPQDDDIIRSKTIAKVTSTTVSCTYDDGSYCVPCVLMAC